MGIVLKKFDLLVRDNSTATQKQIRDYLKRVFENIEKDNSDKDKRFGYAAVFDARSSEYYLYYSNNAKSYFNMTRNRYDLIPKGIITENNIINFLKEHSSIIKDIFTSSFKLITKKLKIKDNGNIELPSAPIGDVVMNTVDVENEEYFESFVVTLDNNKTLIGVPPEEAGKEAIVTYLSCN